MATECRETKKRISRYKIARARVYAFLMALIVFGGTFGFIVGRITARSRVIESVSAPAKECKVEVYNGDESITYYDIPLSHSLQQYITEICKDRNVPVSLIVAMIQYESSFNPEAISDTGDYGLMQINTINQETVENKYHCTDMLNSYQNVYCGINLIGDYIQKYNSYSKALMAYNLGESGASVLWDSGIYNSSYSTAILTIMNSFEGI